jgi:hypothetical protein
VPQYETNIKINLGILSRIHRYLPSLDRETNPPPVTVLMQHYAGMNQQEKSDGVDVARLLVSLNQNETVGQRTGVIRPLKDFCC